MYKIKKAVNIALLVTLIIVSIYKVSVFLQLKESKNRYSSYLLETTNIDVLFLGSSHVRYGFFPMELWNDHGITSFNLAAGGSTIPVSYWTLVNALDYHTPQVIVLDIYAIWPNRVCSTSWGHVHAAFDFFPLSINKYRMVNDLFCDPELTDKNGTNLYEKRWELLWDLGEYHSRWSTLNESDFINQTDLEKNSSIWKGADPLTYITDREKATYPKSTDDITDDKLSKEYLIRILELCKKENIAPILINTGYDCNTTAKVFADSVYDIAADYNVPYLDFTQENIINFNSDLHSTGHNTHVNFSGAEKLTSYIGQYLSKNYTLTDHRYDQEYSSWWSDYQSFTDSKKNYLTSQSDLPYYLLFLADNDYQIIFEINDRSILYENRNQAMLTNLGIDYHILSDPYNLIVLDNETDEISYLINDYRNGTPIDTCIGNLYIWLDNNTATYGMSLDKKEIYTAAAAEDSGRMRISVIEKSTGTVVDSQLFD